MTLFTEDSVKNVLQTKMQNNIFFKQA